MFFHRLWWIHEAGSLYRDAEEIVLRPKTFTMPCYLLERSGQLVSKDELLEKIWMGRTWPKAR